MAIEAKQKRQIQQEMNELQRDMKYQVDEEKADTESKIAMKKMQFNLVMKAFSSMKMSKKFARKAENVERKRTGFGHEVKKAC
ncbi:hypothetical protein F6Y05_01585 (plasmid) [Bacillus megaterium]|nr:hypothetical protein [Priestia megaterium]